MHTPQPPLSHADAAHRLVAVLRQLGVDQSAAHLLGLYFAQPADPATASGLDLLLTLEHQFGLMVSDEELQQATTIFSAIPLLEHKLLASAYPVPYYWHLSGD